MKPRRSRSLNGIELLEPKKSYRFEQGFTLELYQSPDSQESRDAFVEKRDAKFDADFQPAGARRGSVEARQLWKG